MDRFVDTGSSNITYEVAAGVGVITMNKPERRNALDAAMWAGLEVALADAETATDVRCVVLTGAGGAFCAGGDVKGMAERNSSMPAVASPPMPLDEQIHRQRLRHRAISGALFSMPKPTVAAVGGAAAGAGLALALACDMRIASADAVLATAFGKVGLSGDFGGTWFLTQLVGPARAKELYYLGDRIDMETALRLGIVNTVVDADGFGDAWRSTAARLAAGPTIAYRYMKENINRSVSADLGTLLDLEATHHRHTSTTADHREAAQAFVEKRTPVFKGE